MTAKKTVGPLKKPAQPALKPALPDGRTTFEQRTSAMPRLQWVAQPEAVQEPEADSPAMKGSLSDKDVILRLVEMLKGL